MHKTLPTPDKEISLLNGSTSFVVLAYNHEKFITECLFSIENQDSQVDELVIIDDFSSDDTKVLIHEFIRNSSIKFINFIENSNNFGLISSLEMALKQARGDIVLLQAGDDVSSSDRVTKTRTLFFEKKVNVIYSSYEIIDDDSHPRRIIKRSGLFSNPEIFIRKGAAVPSFGAAYNRKFLQYLPLIPKALKNEDDFIGMAALLFGGLLVTEDVLYKYRVHSGSLSSWSTMETDNKKYLSEFYKDQPNRIENLLCWNFLISDALKKSSISSEKSHLIYCKKIIDRKVEILRSIMHIEQTGMLNRLFVVLFNIRFLNVRDIILILLGNWGALLIRDLRRMRLNSK